MSFNIMLKPVGAACNLECRYCYYLDKRNLYPDAAHTLMSDELMEYFVRQYIEAQPTREVLFVWHGGETLLRPLSFYQRALELEQRYAGWHTISNCIQTNGTLLNDDWCTFFSRNKWLVGISIDGPEKYHDAYRRSRGNAPSFHRVMRGIELLNRHRVDWNAMAVVNNLNAGHPLEVYHFLKDIGCHYMQFTPIVERILPGGSSHSLASADDQDAPLADYSVSPRQWGEFNCAIFDEWVRRDVGSYFVQLFDATLANWMGVPPGVCSMARTCGHAGVMEYNGDVYACDHFVFPPYRLGNIRSSTLSAMMQSPRQQAFGQSKFDSLPMQCLRCKYLFACNGECPKNRILHTAEGEPGLNYLCRGYYDFFNHVAPYMDFMSHELAHRRPAANVMLHIDEL